MEDFAESRTLAEYHGNRAKDLRKVILKEMATLGVDEISMPTRKVTKALRTRTVFDSKRFQMEEPELYARYLKTTESYELRVL